MAGWLTKAAAAFGPKRVAAPQPFAIPCDCGAQLAGFRVASHQKLRCLGCDRPILVLPADPYPAVKRKSPQPAVQAAKTVVQPEARSISPTQDDRKSRKKRRSRPKREEPVANKVAEKPEPAAPPEPQADRIDLSPVLAQSKARRRTLRLVIVAIAALIAVTGWSLRNRAIRERARLQIPPATEAGLTALRQGDFATAARELTVAVQGLDTLRRTDVAAKTIRQAHREAVAGQGLSQSNLSELARAFLSDTGAAEDRERRFQQHSGMKWIVFDVGMVPAAENGSFEMDIPWSEGDRTLQVACDFPDLRQFAAEPSPAGSRRAIFAGQIETWLVPDDPSRPAVARLKTSSAFLWSDYDSYLAIGYQPGSADDERETRELLNRQREIVSREAN